MTHERRKPYKPDVVRVVRVDRGDYVRASVLPVLAAAQRARDGAAPVQGFEWLHRLCNGTLVKL